MGTISELINKRKSIRAFLPKAVSIADVQAILEIAKRAPSGNNTQPWRVHITVGQLKDNICRDVQAAFDAQDGSHTPEYKYYPDKYFEPYQGRRRKNGWDLYGLLGIVKGDREATHAQHRKNFEFFGASVGLFFTIDRRLSQGSWLDYGMFLQNVMLVALDFGLETCAQGAWIDYHRIIAQHLNFPEYEQLVCGMAIGYADHTATINSLETVRADLDEFVIHHG